MLTKFLRHSSWRVSDLGESNAKAKSWSIWKLIVRGERTLAERRTESNWWEPFLGGTASQRPPRRRDSAVGTRWENGKIGQELSGQRFGDSFIIQYRWTQSSNRRPDTSWACASKHLGHIQVECLGSLCVWSRFLLLKFPVFFRSFED